MDALDVLELTASDVRNDALHSSIDYVASTHLKHCLNHSLPKLFPAHLVPSADMYGNEIVNRSLLLSVIASTVILYQYIVKRIRMSLLLSVIF
jgi:hypothetical protein